MHRRWSLAIAGMVLILGGSWLAHVTQTAGGIKVEDVRFKGAKGNTMSALLYIPPNASAQTPAPGILAVHGYINSRETQDGFAIEFARRGYVVLALDQAGHGYSDPPAFANGFGGPDGLTYLRSLDFVDKNNIGLEGHSMGGWTVLAAATAMPNDYKSMVLEGSSTGKPFAAEGTTTWPRNVALVFAQYEEFPVLMWGVDRARNVTQSPKLWALFGTQAAVEPGKVYGDLAQGNARVLYTPAITHPAEHISHQAIGYSLDWFAKTLSGGTPRPSDDQIWLRKEIGTLIALIGFVALLIGVFDGLLDIPVFSRLRLPAIADGTMPEHVAAEGRRWTAAFILSAFIPALTYYPAFALANTFVKASPYLPQGITNEIVVWAIINALITLALMRLAPKRASRAGIIGPSILIALATIVVGYAALWLTDIAVQDRLPVLGRRAQIDERQAIPDLPDLSCSDHGLLRDRTARAAPEFLDHGGAARRALSDQHLRADARLHRAAGPAIRPAVAGRKTVQSAARSRLRAALHHHRHAIRAAAGNRCRHCHLYLAADRHKPAGRTDLRPVRDLVCRGRHGHTGGVLECLQTKACRAFGSRGRAAGSHEESAPKQGKQPLFRATRTGALSQKIG